MKNTILTLISLLLFASCSKNNDVEPEKPIASQVLPPESQIGANTFGCIVNNQIFYPRDGQGSLFVNGTKGLIFSGDSPDYIWNEIEIKNAKDGIPCAKMIIHLQGLFQNKEGDYLWKPTNFQNSIDGLMQNYIYAQIFNPVTGTSKYYGSYENSGKVTITRFDLPNRILSGSFSGTLKLYNGTEELEVKNGRFDFKWSTLDVTPFP